MGVGGFRMRLNMERVLGPMTCSGLGKVLVSVRWTVHLIPAICTVASGVDPGWAGSWLVLTLSWVWDSRTSDTLGAVGKARGPALAQCSTLGCRGEGAAVRPLSSGQNLLLAVTLGEEHGGRPLEHPCVPHFVNIYGVSGARAPGKISCVSRASLWPSTARPLGPARTLQDRPAQKGLLCQMC